MSVRTKKRGCIRTIDRKSQNVKKLKPVNKGMNRGRMEKEYQRLRRMTG